MALKVELKPHEKMIIGQAVITNGDQRTKLTIDGNLPILRSKDIMMPEEATTPARRISLCVQAMYLSDSTIEHHETYFNLVKDLVTAAPSTLNFIEEINKLILTNSLYKALKVTRALIAYEEELLSHASSSQSLPENPAGNS
ncbi:MAG: flagellar biosynthesis repressor FlbT [Hyphomicrobiales bacterium]|nr:MAG: flagellar biosynthesis repressor FlbT [Hyphomicrobiales bacterium]